MPPIANNEADITRWGLTNDGKFSIKFAYGQLSNTHLASQENNILWKNIWRFKGPERYKAFLWLCAKNRLTTNICRKHMQMVEDDYCPACRQEPETMIHALRDCQLASDI